MSIREFSFSEFRGSWREIGRQHGEAYRDLIQEQLAATLTAASKWRPRDQALAWALAQRRRVEEIGAHWIEELSGLADGANISLAGALSLQLRPGSGEMPAVEACTSFGAAGDATLNGRPLGGQTRDLDVKYLHRMFVGLFKPDVGPAFLMHSVPGELGGVGINEMGVCVFANSLSGRSRGRLAPPILRRAILECASADAAVARLRRLDRCGPANFLLVDAGSHIRDLEMFPEGVAVISRDTGTYVHANNCTTPGLMRFEDRTVELIGSYGREHELLNRLRNSRGHLTVARCKDLLSDESGRPEPICRRGLNGDQLTTVAGLVADLSARTLHISYGPPSDGQFRAYAIA